MAYIILLIIIAAVGCAIHEALSLSKERKRREHNEKVRAVGGVDLLIGRYNRCLQEFRAAQDEFKYRYENTNDTEALKKANNLISEFEVYRKSAYDFLYDVNVDEYTRADLEDMTSKAEVRICNMEDTLKLFERIRPIKQVREETMFDYSQMVNDTRTFFAGCSTKEQFEKRYKALSKTYHPDSGYGDEETFKQIKEEYEYEIKKLGGK